MVTAMTNPLRSLDVSDDDMRTEGFGDYKVGDRDRALKASPRRSKTVTAE
jgi:hypothetical protein